jgi:hypothetical protein
MMLFHLYNFNDEWQVNKRVEVAVIYPKYFSNSLEIMKKTMKTKQDTMPFSKFESGTFQVQI